MLPESTAGLNVYVGIEPVLEMRLSEEEIDFGVVALNGNLLKRTVTATVSTNNSTGYKLYFSTPEIDGYTDAQLTGMNQTDSTDTVVATIESVAAIRTESNFDRDKWGYSLDEAEFNPLPKYNSPEQINSYDGPIRNDSKDVMVGVKIGDSLPSGRYKGTLVFTAVAEPGVVFSGITKMQEMNPAVCAAEWTPEAGDSYVPTTTLTDTRDNTSYTVKKLADGKCWMTQNLALGDSNTEYTLDSSNSDLPSGATFTLEKAAGGTWSTSVSDEVNGNTSHTYKLSGTNGNLYNWYTAVAGTANFSSTGTGDAVGTICPKGWTLPSYTELVALLAKYGISSGVSGGTVTAMAEPLSLTRAGVYNGAALATGGNYFTKTMYTTARQAKGIVVGISAVSMGEISKVIGSSLRCVAK